MLKLSVLLALSVIAGSNLCSHAATVTGESLSKAITDAKIIAPGYRVRAAIFPAAHEVIVSTYTNAASKDVATDCKVDALLIARKVTETAPQTARVKVRFYDLDQTSYRQVAVTKPEISAFAAGAVKKEELLTSLEVVRVKNAAANSTAENATAAQPTATKSSARNSFALQPTDKLSVFRKCGLMFYYPRVWGAKDMTNQWGDFVELTVNRTSWASIIFRLQDKDTAAQAADDEDRYYWSTHQHVQVQAPRTVLIGYSKNIEALVYYIKDNSNPADPDRFEKHLYFGYKGRIYSLSVRFCRKDQASVSADLNTILATIVRQ